MPALQSVGELIAIARRYPARALSPEHHQSYPIPVLTRAGLWVGFLYGNGIIVEPGEGLLLQAPTYLAWIDGETGALEEMKAVTAAALGLHQPEGERLGRYLTLPERMVPGVPDPAAPPLPALRRPAARLCRGPGGGRAGDRACGRRLQAPLRRGDGGAPRPLLPCHRERLFRMADDGLILAPEEAAWLQIAGALQDLAARLGRLGCTVKEAQPGAFGDHREHHALYRTLLATVTGARLDPEARRQRAALFNSVDDEFSRAHTRGFEGAAGDYLLWHGQREQYRASWRAFFRDWDVVLAPAINVLPYPHIERAWPMDGSDLSLTFGIGGRPVPSLHGLVYPAVSTVAGQPATAFPLGFSREGLPIGLQAIAPYLEDLTPIRFAALLAHEIGGFRRPAGYDR